MVSPAAREPGPLVIFVRLPDRGEGRFDGVRGAQVHPVLAEVAVEGQQLVQVIGDLRRSLGDFAP